MRFISSLRTTDDERRTVLRAIGPVWDGNEVWLLAAGGTLYFAFPLLYASSFSGFYLPLMMVLWLLMLRAIGIEFRTHIRRAVWEVSSISSSRLEHIARNFLRRGAGQCGAWSAAECGRLLLRAAVDKLARGRKRHSRLVHGACAESVALVTLVVHGSSYLATKTEGLLANRTRGVASGLWPVQVLLTILSLIATVYAVPNVLQNYSKWPIGYLVPVVVVGSLAYMYFARKQRHDKSAFLASCIYIVGMLVGAAFALYPNVLPASTGANLSLTIYNTAAGAHGLSVGFVWWTLGMILAAIYFVFIYRMFRGKVRLDETSDHGY